MFDPDLQIVRAFVSLIQICLIWFSSKLVNAFFFLKTAYIETSLQPRIVSESILYKFQVVCDGLHVHKPVLLFLPQDFTHPVAATWLQIKTITIDPAVLHKNKKAPEWSKDASRQSGLYPQLI